VSGPGTPRSDHDLLVEIDTKLSIALTAQGDHELRLRALERMRYTVAGLSALVGTAGGSGLDWLIHR
jgi:hypothetical protein